MSSDILTGVLTAQFSLDCVGHQSDQNLMRDAFSMGQPVDRRMHCLWVNPSIVPQAARSCTPPGTARHVRGLPHFSSAKPRRINSGTLSLFPPFDTLSLNHILKLKSHPENSAYSRVFEPKKCQRLWKIPTENITSWPAGFTPLEPIQTWLWVDKWYIFTEQCSVDSSYPNSPFWFDFIQDKRQLTKKHTNKST